MAQFIGTSMTAGHVGAITRGFFDNTVEVIKNDGTTPVKAFGVPVKLNSAADGVTGCTATSDAVVGFAVLEYGQAVPTSDGKWTQDMPFVSVLKRGYMAVKAAGTPKKGAAVYLDASGALTAEAGSSPSNTAIPNCFFMGPANGGLVEIAYNI